MRHHLWIRPFEGKVVDDEVNVSGDPRNLSFPPNWSGRNVEDSPIGLNRTDIRPHDMGVWVDFCHVYAPNSGTCSAIENLLRVIKWCQIKLAAIAHSDVVMSEV